MLQSDSASVVKVESSLPRPHSRPGVASFVYALFVLGLNAVLITVLAGLSKTANSAGPVLAFAAAAGSMNFTLCLGSLWALALGVIGLVQKERRKVLAAWGVALNGVYLLSIIILGVVWRLK
jgi:hypothetical protein